MSTKFKHNVLIYFIIERTVLELRLYLIGHIIKQVEIVLMINITHFFFTIKLHSLLIFYDFKFSNYTSINIFNHELIIFIFILNILIKIEIVLWQIRWNILIFFNLFQIKIFSFYIFNHESRITNSEEIKFMIVFSFSILKYNIL